MPGALAAAVGWYLFSFGFSIYVQYGNAYSMYGSLTTLILFMFWLYFRHVYCADRHGDQLLEGEAGERGQIIGEMAFP